MQIYCLNCWVDLGYETIKVYSDFTKASSEAESLNAQWLIKYPLQCPNQHFVETHEIA